jgi:transcriptional regulator with XRE-family HTH domain
MDVLERMDELRGLVHLSDYAFCKRCNIPYTTLNSARSRRGQLSVATVQQVCDTFGISLCDFFSDDPLSIDIPDPNQITFLADEGKHTS